MLQDSHLVDSWTILLVICVGASPPRHPPRTRRHPELAPELARPRQAGHCATGWVSVNSQEDVPTPSQKRCEACLRKSNSLRAERRARDPKPMGRPPKQVLRKSNRDRKPKSDLRDRFGDSLHVTAQIEDDDGDELAAQPPVPPPATRRRGRPPKQRPNPTF